MLLVNRALEVRYYSESRLQ